MSKNIPVNDPIFNSFSQFKEFTAKLIGDRKLTNDKFLEMLMNDFTMKPQVLEYIKKDEEIIKKLSKV
ncbi:MAG: hypothetical protein WC623_22250 [Pedobacter sp.]|uniref:hypothetical protein n=1 Tax=Pedobacter sp. TaxID=1411316 RepID=UPI003568BD83